MKYDRLTDYFDYEMFFIEVFKTVKYPTHNWKYVCNGIFELKIV